MNTILHNLFLNVDFRDKIQKRLPSLLYLAEQKYRKGGKLNSAVGFEREKIIIAILKTELGEQCTVIPLAESTQKADLTVDNLLVSIKTIQSNNMVRVYWASDQKSMQNFVPNYDSDVDWLLVNIFWEKQKGGLYYIPKEVFKETLLQINVPQIGSNSRGVYVKYKDIKILMKHPKTLSIPIFWTLPKEKRDYDPYHEWITIWKEFENE